MNRLKNGRKHVINGVENCAEKIVDYRKGGGEEVTNRCKHGRCQRLMAVTIVVKVLKIDVQVLTKKSWIPITIPMKKEAMLFHVSKKNVLMEVQTSFQLVPNHPSTTSAIPFRIFITLQNVLTMRFQIDVKIPLMPSNAAPSRQ